ncbi:hypothetical protein Kpol_1025p32 [Vanderwaltozyma polyspora DSM 70294]|uniref:Methyl methanesulfonate-sensitivity protein 22 n=1 Tax=Vanderwaltozyma polyspora (strain ATCC 22028 / DSM 70294 / BCRC 21397 / CBS 2163 / NBRC 10782 / NRRL Y-8283 / UCD 57-17) TaxID=436907 RepID=A7TKV7_VANPO|nr:uncharacterized protein Kpol_1025p32 [Vanderwaltozyma polyspora DSM 70294]EDO17112.1 hypothetical protein Kpol_1025p32 [Vanderwaltozyma polyspora DSM 70294]
MSSDVNASLYIVPDSEEEDDNLEIIFKPFEYSDASIDSDSELSPLNQDVHFNERESNNDLNEEEPIPGAELSLQSERRLSVSSEENNYIDGISGRHLRKRKAIQKNPYSLERLKHRQFLQGYDITGYDSILDGVKIANKPIDPDSQEKEIEKPFRLYDSGSEDYDYIMPENSDNDNDQVDDRQATDSEAETEVNGFYNHTGISNDYSMQDPITYTDNILNNDQHNRISTDITGSTTQDLSDEDSGNDYSVEEEIKFRGRKLDVKNGYRGILPRILWEKSLKETTSNKKNRSRQVVHLNQKGVAKKKKIVAVRDDFESDLLKEMIVGDDDEDVYEGTSQDNPVIVENNEPSPNDLDELNAYYNQKYKDEYSFDDFQNDYVSDEQVIYLPTGDPENNTEEVEILLERDISDVTRYQSINEIINVNPQTDSANESNRGIIDEMLSNQTAKSNSSNLKSKQSHSRKFGKKRANVRNTNINRVNRNTSKLITSKKSIRKPHSSQQRLSFQNVATNKKHLEDSSISRVTDQIHPNDKEESDKEEGKKKSSSVSKFPGLYPSPNSDISRKINTFVTILEAPSNKYSVTKGKGISSKYDSADEKRPESSLDILHNLDSIQVLFFNKKINPPDVITVHINKKKFTLSKLGSNDVAKGLNEIFSEILKTGVTDVDLVNGCKLISEFILFLNNTDLYYVVDNFNKRFRSKVSAIRDKAKPIHFYQIAFCLLFFYAITKYSTVSNSLRKQIELKIVDDTIKFFTLLSVCYDNVENQEDEYLDDAYVILNLIISNLDNVDEIWASLELHSFRPSVAMKLVHLFPVKTQKWSIIETDGTYHSIANAFKWVNYCEGILSWRISNEIALFFNNIFKRRRYIDFEEESVASNNNIVMSDLATGRLPGTLFNKYLGILDTLDLSEAMREKVIPISQVQGTDPLQILVNRINLLLLIAKNSSINLEKRLEDLLKPLILEYSSKKINILESRKLSSILLTGISTLMEINYSKKLHYKSNLTLLVYRHIVSTNNDVSEIWISYLNRIANVFKTYTVSNVATLKTLYKCLTHPIQESMTQQGSKLIIELLLSRMNELGDQWVQDKLFKIVQSKVAEERFWIDAYCITGKFLLDRRVLSWWSFFMFNNLEHALENKIYFYYKTLEICDEDTYNLIREPIFALTVDHILTKRNRNFRNFVSLLLQKETNIHLKYFINNTEQEWLQFTKKLINTLFSLSLTNLITRLISNILKVIREDSESKDYLNNIVLFINENYYDTLKSNHEFIILKRDLGISDTEMEKSNFREICLSYNDKLQTSEYIENGLISALLINNEISNYEGKIKSLFQFKLFDQPIDFFSKLIEGHAFTGEVDFDAMLSFIAVNYMKVINSYIRGKFLQLTPEEFTNLCYLYSVICKSFPFNENTPYNRHIDEFKSECTKLQSATLNISDGFLENKLLLDLSNGTLSSEVSPIYVTEGLLTSIIRKIIRIHAESLKEAMSKIQEITDPFEYVS